MVESLLWFWSFHFKLFIGWKFFLPSSFYFNGALFCFVLFLTFLGILFNGRMCSFAPVYTVNEKLPLVFICLFVLSVWCTEFFLKMPSRLFYIYLHTACSGCRSKYHKLSGSNNRNLFLTVWRLEVQEQGAGKDRFHSEASFLGLQAAAILLCAHMTSSVYTQGERTSSLLSLLMRTLILSDQGPTLMTSFNLDYLLMGPISKHSHIGG